ncbi:D-serine ammonia-lyase [Peribacillus glennii]|uniref:Probable D-serine dehydratase n=1 Tax=Peribacillus glennii TaxID=2303991 RepID=A0A372LF36_9BACI|nr:D-serine ammonia-lyase [Peribacillus glennii]RFU64900.1 D-serine ammonia-lyase [Peribacillus glennii]
MGKRMLEGKSIEEWLEDHPLLNEIMLEKEVFWGNPHYGGKSSGSTLTIEDVTVASERLNRFAPYFSKAFPETKGNKGIIESPLVHIPAMQHKMEQKFDIRISGSVLVKCDSHLPISGSIKARGGIYEVLKLAEHLAARHGLIEQAETYASFDSETFRNVFNQYSIAVGSTGNLGLSIGIIGAKLGFNVTVHMSADAKQWKKELLRKKGVQVIEYTSDYSKAVEEGRRQAFSNPSCHFIDDEKSSDLFLGYSTAASRLKKQLDALKIAVDEDHPLFVYLPCGVGGAPGGITFGLKMQFGENVHCFFAEPTQSPCFLIGQMTGLQDKVSVQDFDLNNSTEADGLAVGRPSSFVGNAVRHLLSGCFTIDDVRLFSFLKDLADSENMHMEPSALAGFYGPIQLIGHSAGQNYLRKHNLQDTIKNARHIIWGTGGSMVPKEIMESYYQKGRNFDI